ncbi:tRNA (adenosine(37)-N6)-threonylcarbamoyltransferase complex dimerization subunit type 1 TsaB [Legionella impletisoli]|uniref:tRNA threonylcarbamoyladenosine biosynthesis protein TsaB n=1 Tax=Legionella impletisoli TaxID=343510 RepID=A0A917JW90_9GAMM|nr:tRNA (adenosine(37)-N6)-threonylcarbamoyltransferase complex dimerization subunit type 1 TsaB [Legionella impletisoli]GGI85583.1 tRNA (adenosine(37)-N6)-threonylcarbamoyltransferase complex dimerization subunit type 1 TsaB [Legionella impletisoli]
MMNLLAIDTSTEKATVAISAYGQIYHQEQDAVRQHAQLLIPMIEALMAEAAIGLNQLDGIVFGCGPGSFTGLRIACSVAKALAYAQNLPLYPVSTLRAIAFEASQTSVAQFPTLPILAVLDARMNQLYWGEFSDQSYEAQEQVSNAHDIRLSAEKPILLAGVGFNTYWNEFPDKVCGSIQDKCLIYPNAIAMVNLVQSGLVKAVSAEEALPVYIRNQVTHGEPRG